MLLQPHDHLGRLASRFAGVESSRRIVLAEKHMKDYEVKF